MSQMYRHGHIGIALLTYAPIAYGLLRLNHPALALLCGIGVLAVEPLPDRDHRIPWLSHRGVSHSVLAVFAVGAVMAGIGWAVGRYGVEPLVQTLRGTPIITSTHTAIYLEELGTYGPETLAVLGFCVGAFGIFVHLLGDVITIYGIRPLLPLSRWRLSLSSLRAANRVANTAFLIVGVVAIGAVIYTAAPGVSVTENPTNAVENATDDLSVSPVGIASAQENNSSENSSNSVTMPKQTTNGTTVTITNATLSRGGYIVIHGGAYQDAGILQGSAIAMSSYLDNGSHENVTIPINQSPPGGELNQSELNGTDDLTAVLWHETNNNSRFQGITSGGMADTPYTVGENGSQQYVTDTSRITVNGTRGDPNRTTETASVTFNDQQTNGSTLTVENVTLPDGGWVVVTNESYSDDPTGSAVGISRYLEPGNHEDVRVSLLSGGVPENQTLTARPSRDTNDNQEYDYVQSDGFQDTGYTANASSVNDSAEIALQNAAAGLPTMSEEQQNGSNDSFSVINQSTNTPVTTDTGENASNQSSDSSGGSGGLGLLWLIPIVVVVLVLLLYLYIRSQMP
ncbi:metal-dependent hydrolase [Halococcus sp. IIIV-5B]|uniref:metal-dependent hydrolase n=1 Tax=Halococcus sp. IIIV-5B TaxID=2321230 RepID=UPI0011C4AB3E|nr:metal-dependent hydrolase [Halococcus sp. IIIV-5B]